MSIHILTNKISRVELKTIAQESFEVMVKAVVDVEKGILALGGELHADANAALLARGSEQKHLWGINLYPDKKLEDWIALTSVEYVRVGQPNHPPIWQEQLRWIMAFLNLGQDTPNGHPNARGRGTQRQAPLGSCHKPKIRRTGRESVHTYFGIFASI